MHARTGTPIHTQNVSITFTVRVSRFPVIFTPIHTQNVSITARVSRFPVIFTPIHTKNVSITVRVSRFPVIFSEPPICHLYFNLTLSIILVTHTDLYKLHFQIYTVQCITVDDMCWSSPQNLKQQQQKTKKLQKKKGRGRWAGCQERTKVGSLQKLIYIYIYI